MGAYSVTPAGQASLQPTRYRESALNEGPDRPIGFDQDGAVETAKKVLHHSEGICPAQETGKRYLGE